MTNWAEIIEKAKRTAEEAAARIAKQALFRIYDDHFITKSPVWTGSYMSNFHFTEGSPATDFDPPFEDGEYGSNRSGVQSAARMTYRAEVMNSNLKMGATYFVTNTAPYAMQIEIEGSPKRYACGMVKATELVWESYVEDAARKDKVNNAVIPF